MLYAACLGPLIWWSGKLKMELQVPHRGDDCQKGWWLDLKSRDRALERTILLYAPLSYDRIVWGDCHKMCEGSECSNVDHDVQMSWGRCAQRCPAKLLGTIGKHVHIATCSTGLFFTCSVSDSPYSTREGKWLSRPRNYHHVYRPTYTRWRTVAQKTVHMFDCFALNHPNPNNS